MKRFSAAILLVFYLAFSSGLVINLHYCMNRFDSIKLGISKSDVCGKCGMHTTDANKCCGDEVKIFKIDDDQQTSTVTFSFKAPAPDLTPIYILNTEIVQPGINNSSFYFHPPPLSRQDTYLQNCVFRI